MIVKNSVLDYFKRLGIELTDLRFEGIDTTPEYRERLFWLKTGSTPADTVLRMETVKLERLDWVESGGGGGAGLGTGMVLIPQIMNSAGQSSRTSPHSSPRNMPQMRRPRSSNIKILSRMRNQSYTSIICNN